MAESMREERVRKRGRWRKKGGGGDRERRGGEIENESERGGQFASAALQGQCEHLWNADGPKLSTITRTSP